MPEPSRIVGDSIWQGNVSVTGAFTAPNFQLANDQIPAGIDIPTSKFVHPIRKQIAQPNTTIATETRTAHIAIRAGTVVNFQAGSIAPCSGAATVTVDLKKNGASVLGAVITLDNANTARVPEAATISSAAYVAGDWFEVVITATAGGGTLGTGLGVELELAEDPA